MPNLFSLLEHIQRLISLAQTHGHFSYLFFNFVLDFYWNELLKKITTQFLIVLKKFIVSIFLLKPMLILNFLKSNKILPGLTK